MHRGTIFIIIKDQNNKFKVQKSTEFNGGMGIEVQGRPIYEMLRKLEDPTLFDSMIRKFDNEYFGYNDEVMTYFPEEQKNPYIDETGNEYFEYSQIENQFKFFYDDNGEYIYTSDSNYIKNLTDENIKIVCSNGTYLLKPNQILVSDYCRCINNTKISFGEKIDDQILIDTLETADYKASRKEEIVLESIINTLESFDFRVSITSENGMNCGIEIETWTNGGVNMIHSIYFFEDYQDLYDKDNINKKLQEIYENFSIDDEIDLHRQNDSYKNNFSISQSLEDFTEYQTRLKDLSKNFVTKYHENIYQKFMKNEIEKEMM